MVDISKLMAGSPAEARLKEALEGSSITNQLRLAAEASGLNTMLERIARPTSELAQRMDSLRDQLSISSPFQERLDGLTALSGQVRDPFDLPTYQAPMIEVPRFEPPKIDIPPNPIFETNDLLEEMASKSDELLAVQAQQAALIQKLAELAAASLDHARISAAESAQAAELAKSSVKVARRALYIAVISFVAAIAFSSIQVWMSWEGGKETDVVLRGILNAVSRDSAPINPASDPSGSTAKPQ